LDEHVRDEGPESMEGLPPGYRPWPALIALVAGIFMILVDSTIVSVATDAIWSDLKTDLNSVVWVTSGYLLAYVVPLLLSGRLGDQFGPRRVYLAGLTLFTAASVWCGLAGSVRILIVARVVQGLGAALMAPQTMSVITRTFPASKRGGAMALWGSVGGVAILVGPLAGGLLVDHLSWRWVFFVNLPFGVAALIGAVLLVPNLPTRRIAVDWLGIALSGVGLFMLVFGVQEGQRYDWGHIRDLGPLPVSVWGLIVTGAVVLVVFVFWETRAREPLIRLSLFRDRNFALSCLAVATMAFSITGMALPFMLYAQKALGLTPTEAGLLLIPLALLAAVLAIPAGALIDRTHPRRVTGFGFALQAGALAWLGYAAYHFSSWSGLLVPIALVGAGNAFVWGPVTTVATRNVPLYLAGVGSGVYNMTRQVGGVLGSAMVGVLMQHQIDHYLFPQGGGSGRQQAVGPLPEPLREPFAHSMGTSLYLPAGALIIGFVVVQFLMPVRKNAPAAEPRAGDSIHLSPIGHHDPDN
jgi:EmrB/QacA subfamily drug resistance transporter